MRSKNNLDTATKRVKKSRENSQVKIVKKSKAITGKPVTGQQPTKNMVKESSKEEKRRNEFELQIKKVNNLIADGCIRQAYSAIPKEEKFPEKANVIKSMKSDLMEQIWNL
ncbi:hypothetical protein A3860_17365 [Niastella vici]|uniref:ParB-related ThiF-related cassette protein E domain-containing protein n=1 Tax=Niastella vici TaxID=1703345 RepID=A0A1V9G493_9BACT|nr:hypothetical protein [Niastella vici]OQP65433.1 hypothetical protein A3860_17365 [Niastella vici]